MGKMNQESMGKAGKGSKDKENPSQLTQGTMNLNQSRRHQLSDQASHMAQFLWKMDSHSKLVLCSAKFTGALLFGEKLDKAVADNAAKSKEALLTRHHAFKRE
ncbi:hypothetical protein KIL84_013878 [Mauremys mutica]|uniref:Uncharacterized protein n=1 Tax=Mauremys mutica TaxID=74926 RepID=A0A9D4ASI9_9SAUR|nr:hypothetical protein KIL84_013878 [Mauremys mutica]